MPSREDRRRDNARRREERRRRKQGEESSPSGGDPWPGTDRTAGESPAPSTLPLEPSVAKSAQIRTQPATTLPGAVRLQEAIDTFSGRGFTVAARSDSTVDLVRGREFSVWRWLLAGVFFYPQTYGATPIERVTLRVDEDRVTMRQQSREPGWSDTVPVGVAFGLYCVLSAFSVGSAVLGTDYLFTRPCSPSAATACGSPLEPRCGRSVELGEPQWPCHTYRPNAATPWIGRRRNACWPSSMRNAAPAT